jgi:hypothetical protein
VINRREFSKTALYSLLLSCVARASEPKPDVQEHDFSPYDLGLSDFYDTWEYIEDSSVVASSTSREIDGKYIEAFSEIKFGSTPTYEDFDRVRLPDQFFQSNFGKDFSLIYNEAAATTRGKQTKMTPLKANAADHFKNFWSTFLFSSLPEQQDQAYQEFGRPVSLLEYIAYSCIFVHETGGRISRSAETINPPPPFDPPGIAYLFDRHQPTRSKSPKQSYNARPNRTCKELFNDDLFISRFGSLPVAAHVVKTDDDAWARTKFPRNFPSSSNPAETGILLECDFYKFRGRGLIQTTWRDNYISLANVLRFLREVGYDFTREINDILDFWINSSMTADQFCTYSSTRDWDTIFSTDASSAIAVKQHAHARGYGVLSDDLATLNAGHTTRGSILHFGYKINKSPEYRHNLRERIGIIAELIGTDLQYP